jgi:uncharacterized membrane protein
VAIALGALVALSYGAADFLGGFTSSRLSPLTVLFVSQVVGLATAIVIVAALADPLAPSVDLLYGAASGIAGVVALGFLYRGLAGGRMSVVAPLSAVGGGLIPLLWGLAQGERPGTVALVGAAIALVAVVVVARGAETEPGGGMSARTEILLGGAAGIGFGIVFVLLSETSADSGMWPILSARVASVPLIAVVALARHMPLVVHDRRLLVTVAAGGLLDLLANAFLVLAVRRDLTSVVAPIAALYPAGTVVLARLVLGERIGRFRMIGLVLALAGLLLIATR